MVVYCCTLIQMKLRSVFNIPPPANDLLFTIKIYKSFGTVLNCQLKIKGSKVKIDCKSYYRCLLARTLKARQSEWVCSRKDLVQKVHRLKQIIKVINVWKRKIENLLGGKKCNIYFKFPSIYVNFERVIIKENSKTPSVSLYPCINFNRPKNFSGH